MLVLFAAGTVAQVRSVAMVRVHRFQFGDNLGSSFTVEVDGRQYLVTARHLVPGIKRGDSVRLLIGRNEWKELKVTPLFCQSPDVDAVALALDQLLSAPSSVEATSKGVTLGGELFLLGFPFDLVTFQEGWPPFAFAKKAALSAIDSSDKSRVVFYVDALNNRGFSGGPVYYWDPQENKSKFVGVISGYKAEFTQVLAPRKGDSRPIGQIPLNQLRRINELVPSNTGIVVAYDIQHVVEAIRKNPVGLSIPAQGN
jgi:hypothetical protein